MKEFNFRPVSSINKINRALATLFDNGITAVVTYQGSEVTTYTKV